MLSTIDKVGTRSEDQARLAAVAEDRLLVLVRMRSHSRSACLQGKL